MVNREEVSEDGIAQRRWKMERERGEERETNELTRNGANRFDKRLVLAIHYGIRTSD